MKHILKCSKCEKYTLKEKCCGLKTISPKPPKFSPEDKYGDYRREEKKESLRKEELY
tara:strand:- start:647 stop:817 length:171 start_codon:yes stop_codon:yes gene_type:complete